MDKNEFQFSILRVGGKPYVAVSELIEYLLKSVECKTIVSVGSVAAEIAKNFSEIKDT